MSLQLIPFDTVARMLYVLTLSVSGWCSALATADDQSIRKRGEQIYRADCLECHGKAGVGVEEFYPDPLLGDATVGELTKLIAETMPEENRGILRG